jgi:simple sugar transport system substrate-binding protein
MTLPVKRSIRCSKNKRNTRTPWSLQSLFLEWTLRMVLQWLLVRRIQAGDLLLSCDPCIDRSKLVMHAVVHGTRDDPFWQKSLGAMKQAAKDMGFANTFYMELYEEGYSSTEMASTIRNLIKYSANGESASVKQIDGLIVSIPDEIVQAAVEDAIQAGVPVWGVALGAGAVKQSRMLGFLGQDEYNAGHLASVEFQRRRLEAYGQAKRAIFINHNPEDPALEQRFQGFNDSLSKKGVTVDHLHINPDDFYATVLNQPTKLSTGMWLRFCPFSWTRDCTGCFSSHGP